jgi:hypothetical protein
LIRWSSKSSEKGERQAAAKYDSEMLEMSAKIYICEKLRFDWPLLIGLDLV